MNITLKRFISTDKGTFGVLTFGDKKFFTVEKPWVNNIPFTSCIPSGSYTLEPYTSEKYKNHLCMINDDKNITASEEPESSRYACLIHVANYEEDVVGCIGLGKKYLGHMVTSSKDSIREFYEAVDPNETHSLIITWDEKE
jgi:hypothetical protein